MQRRELLRNGGMFAIAASLPADLLLVGCPSASQLMADVEAVLTEAAAIMKTAGQTTWAADFTTAATALQAAYTAWTTGAGTPQKVVNLINALVAVTAAVLPNDPYVALINELVALAEVAIVVFSNQTPPVVPATPVALAPNPHIGAVPPPKNLSDAKKRWNAIAVGPLADARI